MIHRFTILYVDLCHSFHTIVEKVRHRMLLNYCFITFMYSVTLCLKILSSDIRFSSTASS